MACAERFATLRLPIENVEEKAERQTTGGQTGQGKPADRYDRARQIGSIASTNNRFQSNHVCEAYASRSGILPADGRRFPAWFLWDCRSHAASARWSYSALANDGRANATVSKLLL